MFYSKYKKRQKKKKGQQQVCAFWEMKIDLYFYAALLFWILLQLPTWTFYENVNIDSICKKRKGKKIVDLWKVKTFVTLWYFIYKCYFYIQIPTNPWFHYNLLNNLFAYLIIYCANHFLLPLVYDGAEWP